MTLILYHIAVTRSATAPHQNPLVKIQRSLIFFLLSHFSHWSRSRTMELVLYNQVVARSAITPNQNPILVVSGQQLAGYTHSPQGRRSLALRGPDVEFVRGSITPDQIGSHRPSYLKMTFSFNLEGVRWDNRVSRTAARHRAFVRSRNIARKPDISMKHVSIKNDAIMSVSASYKRMRRMTMSLLSVIVAWYHRGPQARCQKRKNCVIFSPFSSR